MSNDGTFTLPELPAPRRYEDYTPEEKRLYWLAVASMRWGCNAQLILSRSEGQQ